MSFPGGTTPGGALWGGAGTGAGVLPNIVVGQGLLYPALRKAAVTLGPQRTPSPAQYQDAIDELNRLIGSLNCDRLFIYSRTTSAYPLTGAKSYTIGISADPNVIPDLDGPRPEAIEAANVISNTSPVIRYPLAIVTELQWAKIRVQDIANAIPQVLYNDRGYPLSTLYLWGQPQAGFQLELFTWQLIPQFASPDDAVYLPPGYEDALVLNLAVRLVTHFPDNRDGPRQVDPNLYQQARESLMRIESINAPRPTLEVGCGCRGGYMNVYSGQIY